MTREQDPRIRLALQKGNDDNEYIGPFISSMVVKQTVEEANRAFLLPTCRRKFPEDFGKERPCLNFHMGRCDGFCRPDGPDAAEYRRRMAQATALLEGKLRAVTT